MFDYKPLAPDYIEAVKRNFEKKAFMKHLGVTLDDVQPGFVEISVPQAEFLTQQHGYFHAGVTATLADVSMGYAAFSLAPPESNVLSAEFKINLVNPALGEKLIARGEVIKYGKTLKICKSSIYALKDGAEKLCAIAQGTMMIIKEH